MKLKIMTSESIAYVKANINSLCKYYQNGENPEDWLKRKMGKPAFKEIDVLEFDDFDLLVAQDKPTSDDITNAMSMYSNLSDLNDSFATDERLWAGLAHTLFYEYMQTRWKNKKADSTYILNHYFFNKGKPRCYLMQSISRLWWLGRLTYNNDYEDDPYKILKFMSHDINGYAFTLFGSNWINSEKTKHLFFEAIFKYINETGNKVDRKLFNEAEQHTNALCGIYLIDACDDDFIINNIYDYLTQKYEELKAEAEYNRTENIKTTGIDKLDNIIKALNSIGGYGTEKEISIAYQNIIGSNLSEANIKYLHESLGKYCPNSREYENKGAYFYQINDNGTAKYKIANEYLTKSNLTVRSEYNLIQKNSLIGEEKSIFNVICALTKDKFIKDDILIYRTQLSSIYPNVDIDKMVADNLKRLEIRGLLEEPEKGIYKKSYK